MTQILKIDVCDGGFNIVAKLNMNKYILYRFFVVTTSFFLFIQQNVKCNNLTHIHTSIHYDFTVKENQRQPYSCSKRKRKDNVLQNFIIIITSSAIVFFVAIIIIIWL